jgi:HK97 family phage major capsid protein/HK97 family phage prohead protease
MNRAYSLFEIKNLEEDKRVISGVATTPTPDRVGDIVEPLGVKFNNPLPLLHHHRSDQPVGQVTFKRPTKQGIVFEARLPHIKEDGPLKTRVDTAWAEVKAGLVRGVSIGFRSIDSEFMDNGGVRFKEAEVFELSLVTIPANAEANIQNIKSFDAEARAASGEEPSNKSIPASREQNVNKPKTKEKKVMAQTTAEKISAFEASRQAKSARMEAIMEESGDETLDESQAEEYETLKGELEQVDKHLSRLHDFSKMQAAKAKAVSGDNANDAVASRGGEPIRVRVSDPVLPKGIGFARLARCKAIAKVDGVLAADVARELYPDHTELQHILKTSISAGTTSTTAWGGALVQNSNVFADFVDYLRPMTIIGRFGSDGIPSLRRVPFRTYLPSMTAGTTGYWVDEGAGKPVSKPTLATTYLTPYKCAAVAVVTMELLRDSNPSVEALIRQDLARAVAAKLDTDFLDPQKAVSLPAGSPASISNGVTKNNSSGRDADSVRADLVTLFAAYIAANNLPTSGVWVMSAVTALQLSLMTNALGQPEFPGINMSGGRLQGLPVLTSEFLGYTTDSPVEGRDVFLVNANDIWFADDGGVDVAMSTEATLEMTDVPVGHSGTPTAMSTNFVSMWQSNSIAFRAERSVAWAKRRSEAVQYMSQVEWGESADSAVQP